MSDPAFARRPATPADIDAIDLLARDLHVQHHAAMPRLFAAVGAPGRDRAPWRASVAGEGRADFNRRAMRPYEELGYVARSTVMGKPLQAAAPALEPGPCAQGAES